MKSIRLRLAHIALCTSILMACAIATAGPSAHRTQEGSGLLNNLFGTNNTAKEKDAPKPQKTAVTGSSRAAPKQIEADAFDGIWKDSDGRSLLIKQIHRTLYVSGSNSHSAWQAQCVMVSELAKCMGNGISNTAGEFSYESSLRLDSAKLQSNWTRNYSNGQSRSGHASFNYNE